MRYNSIQNRTNLKGDGGLRRIEDASALRESIERAGLRECFSGDIAAISCLMEFEPGDFLIREGEPSAYLYFLVEGKIKFHGTSVTGRRVTYGYSLSCGALGEVASLWGRKPRLSVQAVETSRCVAISLICHRETLFEDNRFLRYVCNLLSRRVAHLDTNISNLINYPIEARLAAFILQNAEGDVFRVSLTECAELTSTSYRHLIRIINAFCARGVLRRGRQQFEILDREALSAMAEEAYSFYI